MSAKTQTPTLHRLSRRLQVNSYEWETRVQKSLLETLLLSLYALDTDALRRDLAKLAVFGGAPAAPSQRLDLLRCLYNVMSFFIQDGFSDLIAMCDQVRMLPEWRLAFLIWIYGGS